MSDTEHPGAVEMGMDESFESFTIEIKTGVSREGKNIPWVGLRVTGVGMEGEQIEPVTLFRISPGNAEELGVNLIGAAAVALMKMGSRSFQAHLRQAGRENEAEVVDEFMGWVGAKDEGSGPSISDMDFEIPL